MSVQTWAEGVIRKEVARDKLRTGERFGEAIGIVLSFLVLLFFIENQVQDTGFFTSAFGTTEMVLFYGCLVLGMFAPLLRLFLGRRNQVRPADIFAGAFFVVATSYLLWVFPFDFSHLADLFPESMQFLLDWISNDVAVILFSLAIVVSLIVAIWTAFLYVSVKEWMSRSPPPTS